MRLRLETSCNYEHESNGVIRYLHRNPSGVHRSVLLPRAMMLLPWR